MSKVTLGVADSKLGASINEKLGLKIQHTGFILEILRGLFVSFSFCFGITIKNKQFVFHYALVK
jgi:hypothetical protein